MRPRIKGALSFEGVNFAYPGSTQLALKNVNFSVPAGTMLGLVGRSGSGKSTITRLLQGLAGLTRVILSWMVLIYVKSI